MGAGTFLLLVLVLIIAGGLVWRYAGWVCPSWLVPLLENPYVEAVAGASLLLQRAGVKPGMRVLDAGCGPGRVTIPAARTVGNDGSVTALDVQPQMLDRLRERLASQSIENVTPVLAGLGEGKLASEEFDVAFLVTVLGEVPDKLAALREIRTALRPAGVLSITEVLPDPHYQSLARVRELARGAGFREKRVFSGWLSFTVNLVRDADGNP
jgi:ubiquinone/menaquinone biosynthesis C-methylase UbiE